MKKKIVVVGTGLRGTVFLEEITQRDDCELAAICDSYPTRLAVVAGQIGLPGIPRFTDLRQCLDTVDCHAVINCTTDSAHAVTTIPALETGKYVYLEKPLSTLKKDCHDILEANRRAGGKACVGLNLRLAPIYMKIKELIDQGVLGRVLTIQADEFYCGGKTYFRRWNRLRKYGGGLWITKACHDFDLLYWLAGRKPQSVAASAHLSVFTPHPEYGHYCGECSVRETCPDVYDDTSLPERVREIIEAAVSDGMERPDLCLYNSDKDTFDHGVAVIDFEDDIVATYTVNVVAGFTNRRIRISGTKATIDGDLESQQIVIRHIDPRQTETIQLEVDSEIHGGADGHLIPSFIDFIDGKSRALATPDEAMVSVMMGLAATESSDTGKTVHLEL